MRERAGFVLHCRNKIQNNCPRLPMSSPAVAFHLLHFTPYVCPDRLGRLGANLASLNAKGYGIASALSVPPGFVKDPNSAWYVNSATGMYYDVNSKSYLHAATGKYYYLDVATNSLKEWASAAAAAVAAAPSAAVTEADKFLLVNLVTPAYIAALFIFFAGDK